MQFIYTKICNKWKQIIFFSINKLNILIKKITCLKNVLELHRVSCAHFSYLFVHQKCNYFPFCPFTKNVIILFIDTIILCTLSNHHLIIEIVIILYLQKNYFIYILIPQYLQYLYLFTFLKNSCSKNWTPFGVRRKYKIVSILYLYLKF